MKKMLKIFIGIFVVGIVSLLLLKSNQGLGIFHKSPPINITDTIFAVTQDNKKLFLEVYSKDLELKRKIYLTKTKQDMTDPTTLCKINDEKVLITVGNYENKPIKLLMYNAKEGKINNYGEIVASNSNILIADNKLFAYRRENTKSGSYWIDEYALDNINTKVRSIKIPDSPKKIIYSKNNNSLYLLFVGSTPASFVGMYSFDKDSLTIKTLDEKSFAGDISISEGKAYISMSGYSSDGKDIIDDDRILVLNKNLEQEKVIKTSKSPNLISINGNDLYVTVGKQGVIVDKIALDSGKFQKNYTLNSLGKPLDTRIINNRLFILDSGNLYVVDGGLENSEKELSGKTLSIWQDE